MATAVAIFSAAGYVRDQMKPLLKQYPKSFFVEATLSAETARLSKGAAAVCVFVNDVVDKQVIEILKEEGVQLVCCRCAGFDRVDLAAAKEAGIRVARVPAYSPYAVAEHAIALTMCLNRKLHRAFCRVREGNFGLSGLVGFDMHGKTVGILGTGKIGTIAATIFKGFGMRVLGYDPYENDGFKAIGEYASFDEVLAAADVLSLHLPLMPSTHHIIGGEALAKLKHGALLVNVSRGGLVDTDALIEALRTGQIGGAGLDVYENEGTIFFKDLDSLSLDDRMQLWDAKFALLRSFPNVIITPHSAFLTQEAMHNICSTTIQNVEEFEEGREKLTNEVL